MTGSVRVTGILRSGEDGALTRFEVEVQGGSGRLRFTQAPGPLADSQIGALVIDGAPAVVVFEAGGERGALVLPAPRPQPLPAPTALPALVEERVLALAPLLGELGDGLYTVGVVDAQPARARSGWVKAGSAAGVGVVDLPCAVDGGVCVVASLGGAGYALLAGRRAAGAKRRAWVIAADVVVDAPGFVARAHDRGAREAFARAHSGVLDDGALRDAIAWHRAAHPDDDLGPFTEDRVEPAAQQARALIWDLRAEDGVENVGDVARERVADATEFRARVRVKSVMLELAFVSKDGRRVDEAVVRSGGRFRATGLRPAARTLARTLRQLADEGL